MDFVSIYKQQHADCLCRCQFDDEPSKTTPLKNQTCYEGLMLIFFGENNTINIHINNVICLFTGFLPVQWCVSCCTACTSNFPSELSSSSCHLLKAKKQLIIGEHIYLKIE